MTTDALAGPWRRPRNTSANEKGGIHDDETAQALGFDGGTVAGSIHMEQFPTFLIEHLGDQWLTDGTISLYFHAATTDGDPVRCIAQPSVRSSVLTRMSIGMLDEQGAVVMDSSASIGGVDAQSALREKLNEVRPATDIRVLADVRVGEWCTPFTIQIPPDGIDRQLRVITEPMSMFGNPGTTDGRVPPLSTLVHAMRGVEKDIAITRGPFVGLFGAIEIAYHQGQPITGKNYTLKGSALAIGDSPKTEIFWMESVLLDGEQPVVTMIKMDRVMKASSPLWASH